MRKYLPNLSLHKTIILQGICFSLSFFCFMLAESTVNRLSIPFFGPDMINHVYCIGLVHTGLGFLFYSITKKLLGRHSRGVLLCFFCFSSLCVLSSVLLLFAGSATLFCMASSVLLFSCGYVNACIYYYSALLLYDNPYAGRVIGLSMCSAIVLQFLVQAPLSQDIMFIVSMISSIILISYIMFQSSHRREAYEVARTWLEPQTDWKTARILILATIIMTIIASMIDGVITVYNATGQFDIFREVRLFYALGLLLAGFISDYKRHKYVSLATLCLVFSSSICTTLLANEVAYFIAVSLMYIYMGFYVMFFTVLFIDFAPQTRYPSLWAGLGRILRSLVTAAVLLPTYRLYQSLGILSLTIGSCIFSVLLFLVLLKTISYSLVEPLELPAAIDIHENPPLNKEELFEGYGSHYSLTPREMDVLRKLLFTEDSTQEIAEALFISRRVLQRNISSLYEKTNTKSRIGLFQSFSSYAEK